MNYIFHYFSMLWHFAHSRSASETLLLSRGSIGNHL
ncbi:hypothetical protein H5410_002045 [Solanum commersonii]|uniref:Uncharacterized protein n=1 Tax=Solanum commersonii TaxID=4109 RepID=A0A9J6B0U0_SOLCO|nr:hypothetical protein H5410_002045 [Solanum commersonii]